VAVGGLHFERRIVGLDHDIVNQGGQQVETSGGSGGALCFAPGRERGIVYGRCEGGDVVGRSSVCRELVEADGGGLTEIHGWLERVSGDLDEDVTKREIVAGEAVFFGTEHEGDAAVAAEMLFNDGRKSGKRKDGLLRLAIGQSAGANNESAIAHGFGKRLRLFGILEQFRGADGGACFTPVGLIRGDDGHAGEGEVGHGARDCSNVERIARRDEHYFEAVALGVSEQEIIVERGMLLTLLVYQ